MSNYFNIYISFFNLAISAFMIYSAIKGSGVAYKSQVPKEIKKESDAFLRKFYAVVGPLMLILTILGILKVGGNIFIIINIIFVLLAVLFFIVWTKIKFKRKID